MGNCTERYCDWVCQREERRVVNPAKLPVYYEEANLVVVDYCRLLGGITSFSDLLKMYGAFIITEMRCLRDKEQKVEFLNHYNHSFLLISAYKFSRKETKVKITLIIDFTPKGFVITLQPTRNNEIDSRSSSFITELFFLPDSTTLYMEYNLTLQDVLNTVYSRKDINYYYILDRNDTSSNMGRILFQFVKDRYQDLRKQSEQIKLINSTSSFSTHEGSLVA